MKKLDEILPPDTCQIDKEVDDLFTHDDITSVSNWSGIRYSRLAAMLRVDDPQENCVTEAFKVWYGVTRNEKEKGRAFFRLFERQSIVWKLFDDSPLALMQSAIDRLSQIKPEEVKYMSDEDQQKLLVGISIIEDLTGKFKSAACNGRRSVCEPVG